MCETNLSFCMNSKFSKLVRVTYRMILRILYTDFVESKYEKNYWFLWEKLLFKESVGEQNFVRVTESFNNKLGKKALI